MATKNLSNGFGEILSDALAIAKPIVMSGNVWWVNSAIGVDAAGTAGQDREKPLATLGQAVTNAAAQDIILLQSGHTETRTVALSIAKALTIVGVGTAGGKPAAQISNNSAAGSMITLDVAGIELRNIYFPTNQQSNSAARIFGTLVNGSVVRGCYFECGPNDQGDALNLDGCDHCRVLDSTFISIATTRANRPSRGLHITGVAVSLDVSGTVFADGTVGFVSAAFDASIGTQTNLHGVGVSLLGSTVNLSGCTGWLNPAVTTGGAKVIW